MSDRNITYREQHVALDGQGRLERTRLGVARFRGRFVLGAVQAIVLAVGVLAASATACEGGGGGGGKELTTLSTKLSGEGKEGEALTVLDGSKVKDKATLSGKNASKATGKATYKIFSDKECKTLVTTAGEVTVSGESVPASAEEELEGGKTYYWQVHYGGDSNNAESTSPCTEVLTVKAVLCTLPYCEPTITPGVKLAIAGIGDCTASPIMTMGAESFLLTSGHCLKKGSTGTQTIVQKMESAWPATTLLKEIGKNVTFNNTTSYDIAEVKIENAVTWLLGGGGDPPFLVEWEATPKVTPVLGEAANLEGEATCISGAVSGLQCGKVLAVGVGRGGVANMNETSVKITSGDSGAPEFVQVLGGVLVQGVVSKSSGRTFPSSGELSNGSTLIKKVPSGTETCTEINKYKLLWQPGPEVTATAAGIPAETTVTQCIEELGGLEATLRMSAAATQTGVRTLTIGYANLSWYEPMSQIKAVFPGQTLLVK